MANIGNATTPKLSLKQRIEKTILNAPRGLTKRRIYGAFPEDGLGAIDDALTELLEDGPVRVTRGVFFIQVGPVRDLYQPKPKKDPAPHTAQARTLPLPFYGARDEDD